MIKLTNVKKKYNEFELDCSLEVSEGKCVGLIGEHGSGKTTILKIVLNLLHKESGELSVFEHARLSVDDKQNIGAVLLDASFSEYMTIKDIIPVMEQLYSCFDKKQFIESCQKNGLPIKKQIATFSPFLKRKYQLLLALSHQAQLIVIDDIFAHISNKEREELYALISSYKDSHPQASFLLATRDIENIQDLCDEYNILNQGQIIYNETKQALLSDYGLLKMDDNQFLMIDKRYIVRVKKERYGYSCLTNYYQFYQQRYHETMIIEQSTIHTYIKMMIEGETL